MFLQLGQKRPKRFRGLALTSGGFTEAFLFPPAREGMSQPIEHTEDGDPRLRCPGVLSFFLTEMLYQTLLCIRANARNPDYCHALADHAHNIPGMLKSYQPELLIYYWEAERPCFLHYLEQMGIQPAGPFRDCWSVIEKHYQVAKTAVDGERPT
jgi:hypothetical protein